MKITLLSEQTADCVLVTLGVSHPTFILIDGGLAADQVNVVDFCKKHYEEGKVIDLIVLTHVDGDHIGGLLHLFNQDFATSDFIKQVWFNSKHPLEVGVVVAPTLDITYTQGNKLTRLLSKKRIPTHARVASATSTETINELCEIRILGPSKDALDDMLKEWPSDQSLDVAAGRVDHLDDWNALRVIDYYPDKSRKNKSSIVVLIHCLETNKKALFTGDSVPEEILKFTCENPEFVDFVKLPHHGSKNNINCDLIKKFPSNRYLVTAGAKGHKPHKKSIQVLIDNVQLPIDLYVPVGNWTTKKPKDELVRCGCNIHPYNFSFSIEL